MKYLNYNLSFLKPYSSLFFPIFTNFMNWICTKSPSSIKTLRQNEVLCWVIFHQ